MISLLPIKARKTLTLERRLRFMSLVMLVLAFVAFVSLALSIPTWMLLTSRAESLDSEMFSPEKMKLERTRVEDELKQTQSLIDHLVKKTKTRSHSGMISDLDSLSGDKIKLTQFIFDDKNKLTLIGTADTRIALSEFRDRLDSNPDFKSVELPLSSLVSEVDAAFSIAIVLD